MQANRVVRSTYERDPPECRTECPAEKQKPRLEGFETGVVDVIEVEDRGFEPEGIVPQGNVEQSDANPGLEKVALALQSGVASCHRLAIVINAWTNLAPCIKETILHLVESATRVPQEGEIKNG